MGSRYHRAYSEQKIQRQVGDVADHKLSRSHGERTSYSADAFRPENHRDAGRDADRPPRPARALASPRDVPHGRDLRSRLSPGVSRREPGSLLKSKCTEGPGFIDIGTGSRYDRA